MLSFPTHCSHKLQPLDRAVCGPLKQYYNAACDGWIISNKYRPMTILTYQRWWSLYFRGRLPRTIFSRVSGSMAYPFDSEISADHEFMPSDVTNRPNPEVTHDVAKVVNDAQSIDESPPIHDATAARGVYVQQGNDNNATNMIQSLQYA